MMYNMNGHHLGIVTFGLAYFEPFHGKGLTFKLSFYVSGTQFLSYMYMYILYYNINNNLSVKNDKSHLAGTLQKEYRD